ncbi:hypothetical protein [Roseiconus lacunae]|uniref:hypothetical protein n=1 Tax=Roseiconus lacunae TaxID=2605694 RepID=UPI001E4C6A0F|nr:hypothetical protein [Roseiconus lacunae]MCD0459988.1 hypothetical protein [Roseiconus lacunae]
MSLSTSNSSDNEEGGEQARGAARRFPAALAIALIGVAAIEIVASKYEAPFDRREIFLPSNRVPNVVETIVETKLELANEKGPKRDLVVLGDSSGLMGVVPELLGQQLRLSAYNLCTISLMGVEGHQMIFERFIETHGAPQYLVYHFAPRDTHFSDSELHKLEYRKGVRDWIGVAKGELSSTEGGDETRGNELSSVPLPTLKFRRFSQAFLQVISPEAKHREVSRGKWASHNQMRDAMVFQSGFLEEVNLSERVDPMDLKLILSSHHASMLRDLLRFCEQKSISVLIVANPLPEYTKTSATVANLEKQRKLLREVVAERSGVQIAFNEQRFYSDEKFATVNHLTPGAAITNTKEIAERLLEIRK